MSALVGVSFYESHSPSRAISSFAPAMTQHNKVRCLLMSAIREVKASEYGTVL
ncbi:hypothetical protein [Enterobacter ludwigii]|uniref:hypothetical protein n=1 Tax=Enterobacter ludwigii TaxID=299767 RepID=UPI001868FB69|nr:hypothetical protein [Enterobacter ludwigii]